MSINRRVALAGLALAGACPSAARARQKVRALTWEGRAHVDVGGRSLDLAVRTRLKLPLLQVRSTTWIVAEGPAKARTMVLEPTAAWVELSDGKRPLPIQTAIHERQQYAIYHWLLMVQQREHRPGKLPLSAPPYPDIVFEIGRDGYPVSAELKIEAAELGKPQIEEHVAFAGRIDDNGVRWPRRFTITQHGKPYFALDVDRFSAERG